MLLEGPFEDRVNKPGEEAGIVVVNLETGETKEVARTRGWEFQIGANQQWGKGDETILFDGVETESRTPVGVRLNWTTGSLSRMSSQAKASSSRLSGGSSWTPSRSRSARATRRWKTTRFTVSGIRRAIG